MSIYFDPNSGVVYEPHCCQCGRLADLWDAIPPNNPYCIDCFWPKPTLRKLIWLTPEPPQNQDMRDMVEYLYGDFFRLRRPVRCRISYFLLCGRPLGEPSAEIPDVS